MNHKEFEFNYSNTIFYGQAWHTTSPKAVILLVHGIGEHSGRYAQSLVPKLISANLAVISYDQFGHGKTLGKRGHCPSYSALLDCIDIITLKANEIFGELPTILYGHSMGGNIIINYLLKRKHQFIGAVATSPFIKLAFEPPKWKLKLAKIMKGILPSITMSSNIESKAISRDPDQVAKYINDPLVHDKVSPNYSISMIDSGLWALHQISHLELPLLIMHGTADRITSWQASQQLADNNPQITLKLFPEAYHELHHDLCNNEMAEALINWINNLTQPN